MAKLTPKRPRADSLEVATKALEAAKLPPLAPPPHLTLRPCDGPFFDAIVTARPRDTWTTADLVVAVQLARGQADMELLQESIDESGLIIDGKINPAAELLDKMARRCLAMARQLKVDTIATVGKAQDIHKGAAVERIARGAPSGDMDLIPGLGAMQ